MSALEIPLDARYALGFRLAAADNVPSGTAS